MLKAREQLLRFKELFICGGRNPAINRGAGVHWQQG